MTDFQTSFQTSLAVLICVASFSAVSPSYAAEFIRTSPVMGTFCRGFIIEKCEQQIVDAISEKENGQLFSFAEAFPAVDEYQSVGFCHLYNNYRTFDPKHHAHRKTKDGNWEYLGIADSFNFDCQKQ